MEEDEKTRQMRAAYARMWEAEFAFADEIAEANREDVLALAARATDPMERSLLLLLAGLALTGGRDSWRIDEARRAGCLAELVERMTAERTVVEPLDPGSAS